MRGGADGVGASQPQLVPATILRKNFEFVAAIKPHELPNRPQFYMIGSGITEASIHALTVGATCTHKDFRAPCFTAEEIEEATKQVKIEQSAFDALTVEEQVAHTAAGGLAEAAKVASYTEFKDTICKYHVVTVMMTGDLKALSVIQAHKMADAMGSL